MARTVIGPHHPTGTLLVTDHLPSACRVKGVSTELTKKAETGSAGGQLVPAIVTGWPTIHFVVLIENVVPRGI
jgi:hypothetical protein